MVTSALLKLTKCINMALTYVYQLNRFSFVTVQILKAEIKTHIYEHEKLEKNNII